MLIVHGTKKLRHRVGGSTDAPGEATTALGRWHATSLLWRPQLALFVHDSTLLPILMPLAPAATVLDRFPARLAEILELHGVARPLIEHEITALAEHRLTPTASRSLVGTMNEFTHFARAYRNVDGIEDLDELSMRLAKIPCSPLYKSHVSPDRELAALLNA
jgi:hypothetical protein